MPQVMLGRPASYEDLAGAPDHMVAEIIDGELWTTPRPAPRHARAQTSIGALIVAPYDHGRGGPGGWQILFEPELHLGPDVLVPDVAGWRRVRMPRLPDTSYFPIAPDWICEVISPSTALLDRTRKLHLYAREQVRHTWILDPMGQTLEVLRLEGPHWMLLASHGGAAVVRAEPFSEVEIDLSLVWEKALTEHRD